MSDPTVPSVFVSTPTPSFHHAMYSFSCHVFFSVVDLTSKIKNLQQDIQDIRAKKYAPPLSC